MATITTKLTAKTGKNGVTYVHEIFLDGVRIDRRTSKRAYREAAVVRRNRAYMLRHNQERLAEAKANVLKYADTDGCFAGRVIRYEREIANTPDQYPAGALGYSNTGKYNGLDSGIFDVVGYAKFPAPVVEAK